MFKGYFFLFPAIHFVLLIVPGLSFAREWQFDELEIQYVRCLGFWPVFFSFVGDVSNPNRARRRNWILQACVAGVRYHE